MLLRQALHDVRVRKPKKKMVDLGFEFEKNVQFRIQIWKKRYGMFFECLCTKKNDD